MPDPTPPEVTPEEMSAFIATGERLGEKGLAILKASGGWWASPWGQRTIFALSALLAGIVGAGTHAAMRGPSADAVHIGTKLDKALSDPPAPTPPVTPVTPPVDPPKPSPAKITPAAPKSGDLVVVSTDATNALFDFDGVFPPGAARQSGQELTIALPKNDTPKSYTIRVIYCNSGKITIERVEIKADGGTIPPSPPDITAALNKLTDQVATVTSQVGKALDAANVTAQAVIDLKSRVTALEKNPPVPIVVPPVDPFTAAVQVAYVADGKPAAAAAALAGLYKVSPNTVNNPTFQKYDEILAQMHTAAQAVLGEPDATSVTILPKTRRAIANELNAQLGKIDKMLDAGSRLSIVLQFARVQAALEVVK